jgi:hypothetical protein
MGRGQLCSRIGFSRGPLELWLRPDLARAELCLLLFAEFSEYDAIFVLYPVCRARAGEQSRSWWLKRGRVIPILGSTVTVNNEPPPELSGPFFPASFVSLSFLSSPSGFS